MHLRLEHCTLRTWRADDAEVMTRHANNENVARNLRDAFPHPYTLADAHAFLAMVAAQDPVTFFCIAVDDEPVGGIGYTIHTDVERHTAEIGYWLSEAHWGRGITTEAVRALTAHAIRRHGLRRLFATPFSWNPASARVLEKAGYRLEGRLRCAVVKRGRLLDQLLYAYVAADCPEVTG